MAGNPYSKPEIYELAFSWRDYPKAVAFLKSAAANAGAISVASMVELGCGPGQYCREFARQGGSAFGIDLSPEMVAYANSAGESEKLDCKIIEADMRSFVLPKKVDLACCMMATFDHLLSNRDVLDHFNAVADNLTEDGLYIIELPHPRDGFEGPGSTKNVWEMENETMKVSTDWASDSVFDPLTEIDEGTVKYVVEQNGKTKTLGADETSHKGILSAAHKTTETFESTCQLHRMSLSLLRALIDLSGRFKIASMYGDLDINQTLDNSKKSWRMVVVLRKYI